MLIKAFGNNKYIYSYTDHLDNVRLSYFKNQNGSAEVLEENRYYPFGLKHDANVIPLNNSSYHYQYNGKEYQQETGWSDYGARMYMSDIGRWGVIDPLAETSRRFNPYNYAYNNPISFIDPDGRKAMAVDESWAWNVSAQGSGWFNERRNFGSFDEFIKLTSSNEKERGSGGGSNNINDEKNGKLGQYYDYIVNSWGEIISKKPSKLNHNRIFGSNGKEIKFNDLKFDGDEITSRGEGDVIYKTISQKTFAEILLKAGVGMNPWLRFSGLGYLKTAYDSHNEGDFGYNDLVSRFKVQYSEYDGYGHDGSFYRIAGQNTIYNLADMGNFLWGAWMRTRNYSKFEIKFGANINNIFSRDDRSSTNFSDSLADQQAIINGWNYMDKILKK